MAPKRERQTKSTPHKRVPSPESQQDPSQASSAGLADSQGADDINAMVQQALKENKTKRSKRTQQIHTHYCGRVRKVEKKIDSAFNQYEKDIKTLRAAQTAKLAALLKRKLNIEQKMLECVSRLDEAYKNIARDLQVVAKERGEELEKAMAHRLRESTGRGVPGAL